MSFNGNHGASPYRQPDVGKGMRRRSTALFMSDPTMHASMNRMQEQRHQPPVPDSPILRQVRGLTAGGVNTFHFHALRRLAGRSVLANTVESSGTLPGDSRTHTHTNVRTPTRSSSQRRCGERRPRAHRGLRAPTTRAFWSSTVAAAAAADGRVPARVRIRIRPPPRPSTRR